MPLYDYFCPKCGAGKQDIRTIEERHDAPACPRLDCHTTMQLRISPVPGFVKDPAVPRRPK